MPSGRASALTREVMKSLTTSVNIARRAGRHGLGYLCDVVWKMKWCVLPARYHCSGEEEVSALVPPKNGTRLLGGSARARCQLIIQSVRHKASFSLSLSRSGSRPDAGSTCAAHAALCAHAVAAESADEK